MMSFDSPIGVIALTVRDGALTGLKILAPHNKAGAQRVGAGSVSTATPNATDTAVLSRVEAQLREYFAGTRTTFDLPIQFGSGTPFQRAVWHELEALPFGESATYGDLARAVGQAGASRAIGGAVGANPIPIVVPCHRILAGNGRITGYSSGAGIPTKAWLLAHEHITYRE